MFQELSILCFFILLSTFSFAETNITLKKELLEMAVEDQRVRKLLIKSGCDNNNFQKKLLEKINKVDKKNTARLKSILKEYSWPTKDSVGAEGMSAIFLIIQHSPDYVFKERALYALKKLYLNGDGITGQEIALLTDRLLIHQGKKQIFGTQADIIDSRVVLKPIQDKANVDKRRKEMGMLSLSEYVKIVEKLYGVKKSISHGRRCGTTISGDS
ncbi:DUF6624 domain-containing protein [Microbulbifer sp. 2205BS26-8]|uniref:DUF6624 domain-containing protein n=1 Tax=Microbulbifer sp. 2205BS26-8 TaxID=3064386 RepID=UPI00273DDA82|nr:DUF6624 domain-containing protein [Microbulbifer sp. 2205BS26-8]MDP5211275.1 hypothetical protein [Microbulbifer sp. 2205BS26-8]